MQLLLGLFFFSILLATGNSLSCEICVASGSDCSSSKTECPPNFDACMTVMGELTAGGQKTQLTSKSCTTKDICKSIEEKIGKSLSTALPDILPGSIIKKVTCSKAPPSFASFFPAFLGLLLMKLLF